MLYTITKDTHTTLCIALFGNDYPKAKDNVNTFILVFLIAQPLYLKARKTGATLPPFFIDTDTITQLSFHDNCSLRTRKWQSLSSLSHYNEKHRLFRYPLWNQQY